MDNQKGLTKSKRSLLPHWDGEIYTKLASPFYDVVTRATGWRGKLARHALTGLTTCKMLDLGCGTGYLMNLAALRGFNVFGVDPSQGMLNKGKS